MLVVDHRALAPCDAAGEAGIRETARAGKWGQMGARVRTGEQNGPGTRQELRASCERGA